MSAFSIKHRLIDEGHQLSSWVDEKNDCCKWAGIVCDNMIVHVHRIHLPGLNDLKQLKHLDLNYNDFGWIQVREFIGSLGNLRFLNLSSSNFGGIIPPQLGNLSNLHTVYLGTEFSNMK
ncbi:leucine-rich repeat protein [Artemisia annua]|uniref:Leucine-rich repeat protein n=1 Tax=Artemisia annua TaxID=35608 RepID=A0A2U1L1Q9_ARTAN|nr:leucine-rich repeat protein [Artemisia annua]